MAKRTSGNKTATAGAGAPEPGTAREVLDVVRRRWPDDQYLTVEEAPEGAGRNGRRIDLLAISQWKSRGYEIDAVEVKVSVSDWRRELRDPHKADYWWAHSNRYWIAVPASLAATVRAELPDTWGLLAVTADRSRVIVPAAKHDAEPFTWEQTVGLLRAGADAGVNALARARAAGHQEGFERGVASATGTDVEARAQRQLSALEETVAAFEAASGIRLRHSWGDDARQLGQAVHALRQAANAPERVLRPLERNADALTAAADQILKVVNDLRTQLHDPAQGTDPTAEVTGGP